MILTILLTHILLVFGCNYVKTKATDKTVTVGRDMQFAEPLDSLITTHPLGEYTTSPTSTTQRGMSWYTHYGYVGVTALSDESVDGVNVMGLQCSALYLPGYTQYQQGSSKADRKRTIIQLYFCDWVLANFESVPEVKSEIPNIIVEGANVPGRGVIPLHYAITDRSGKSIVVEYSQGTYQIYDNHVGVLTNSPTYDWHIDNLKLYAALSPLNPRTVDYNGEELGPSGNWGSMRGLPADATGPSRFVKLAVLLHYGQLPEYLPSGAKALTLVQQLLNVGMQVNGTTLGDTSVAQASVDLESDASRWQTMYDLKNLKMYYRTYNDWTWGTINIRKLKLGEGDDSRRISIFSGLLPIDTTSELLG